jgi:cytochrome c oxidase assembly factor CtaG
MWLNPTIILLTTAAVVCLWYSVGVQRLWRTTRCGSPAPLRVAAFFAGTGVEVACALPPVDTLAQVSLSAHMIQHLMIMLIGAPLLVLSRPGAALWAALPGTARAALKVRWANWNGAAVVRLLLHPLGVWLVFNGVFAAWHTPAAFEWAGTVPLARGLELMSFAVSALAFWFVALAPPGLRRIGYGTAIIFIASSAVIGALPGALMIFAPRALFAVDPIFLQGCGLTPLEDQQFAGLLMWIPMDLVYFAACAFLFIGWLREADRRATLATIRRGAATSAGVLLCAALLAGCNDENPATGLDELGDANHGASLIKQRGCGGCHVIPGIAGANGVVGPPLTGAGRRVYIAGVLRNTPDNMALWITDPQRIIPGNAMPNAEMSTADARDIAAFLYALK